jgi:tetratricopeptide (TPR) repeat protein
MTYKYWGRFDEGRLVYERALAILERSFGEDHPDRATLHHNLGGLEHARREFEDAEPHARLSVEIRRQSRGPEHVSTAEDEAAWAPILHALGRDDEAEALLRHALPILERELGEGHPEVAGAWNNLGSALRDDEAAIEAYRRALVAKEAALGREHPSVAITLNNIAVKERRRGRLEDAEALYRRAVEILEASVEPDHPNLLLTRRNLDRLVGERKKAGGSAV